MRQKSLLQSTLEIAQKEAELAASEIHFLQEENAVFRSQIWNADINLEQVKIARDAIWSKKIGESERIIERLERELSSFQNSYMNLQKRVDTSGRVLSALMACASELEGIENPRMEGEDGIKVHTLQEAVDALSEAMGKPFDASL